MLKNGDKIWLDEIVGKIHTKMSWVTEKSREKIPYTTFEGVHDNRRINKSGVDSDGISWWTNGFWAGMNWLMYHETGQEKYAITAKKTDIWLDECFDKFYGIHHDVGFMWLLSSIANYKITGDKEGRRRGLHAANILAGRFNPIGKFIRAWDGTLRTQDTTGWAIIDCMLNIPLLYWAYEEIKDPRFYHIATMHADTVMENFIRPDGSSEHIVEFDPMIGGKVTTYGGQGYSNGSAWARGQSWALYGFMMSYIHTKNEQYLETAKRVAHYFIANIPENGLIPQDFRMPKESAIEDSSAAGIAACGLIEISKVVNEHEKDLYLDAAIKMLRALSEKRCDWTKECDAIIQNCTSSYHGEGHNHHITMTYGDFFFIEAIFKLKENDIYLW
ncbi:glycoside hydrolase family 88 protein [Vallitaleaceae bacterium 9-2]